MNFMQILEASSAVAMAVGGSFSQALPAITFILHVIAQVEAMHGLSGPQKLEMARQLIHEGLDTVPVLAKLTADPARLEAVVDNLVSVANLFVK
jgi:hypothetical protein